MLPFYIKLKLEDSPKFTLLKTLLNDIKEKYQDKADNENKLKIWIHTNCKKQTHEIE